MDETRKQDIIIEIDEAKQTYISLRAVEDHDAREDSIMRDFLHGIVDSMEYHNRFPRLTNAPYRVILYSVEELQFSLDYLDVSEEEQQEVFEHELAHFHEAKAHGLRARFALTFYRTETGQIAMIPGTQIHPTLKNTLTDDERRRGMRASIVAPKELSPTDRGLLQ